MTDREGMQHVYGDDTNITVFKEDNLKSFNEQAFHRRAVCFGERPVFCLDEAASALYGYMHNRKQRESAVCGTCVSTE